MLLNAFVTSATVMLVIGATGAMAWLITVEQVAVELGRVEIRASSLGREQGGLAVIMGQLIEEEEQVVRVNIVAVAVDQVL